MLRQLMSWLSGGREAVAEKAGPAPTPEQRRHQRVQLPGARVYLGASGPFPIVNLSFGGLRVALASGWVPLRTQREAPARAALGDQVEAVVELMPSRFATRLVVKNLAPEAVGFAFQGLSYEAAQILAGYLRPAILGASLTEMTGAGVKSEDPGLRLRWFEGQDGTKVYLWQTLVPGQPDQGAAVREEFYFADYLVIWRQDHAEISTQRLRSDEPGAQPRRFGRSDEQAVVYYDVPPYKAMRMGQAILAAAALPPEVKDPLLEGIARAEDRLYRRYLVRSRDRQLSLRLAVRPEVPLPIVDLSERGLALMTDAAGAQDLAAQGPQAAQIELAGRAWPCTIRRVYQQRPVTGCSFELSRPEDTDALAAFLAPRMLAQHLELDEQLPEEMQQVPGGGRAYLYVGLHNSHLYTRLRTGGQLHDGRLVVGEHVLVAGSGGLRYYRNLGPLLLAVNPELPTGQLEAQSDCPAPMRELARDFLAAAEILASEVREAWLKVF